MENESEHPPCEDQETARVAEPAGAIREVIPFVSPEKAAEVFSSMRVLTWEEQKEQIDRSLGRLGDSE